MAMQRDQRPFAHILDLDLLPSVVWYYDFTICKGVLVGGRRCAYRTYQPYIYEGLAQVYKLGHISSPIPTENHLMFLTRSCACIQT